MSFMFRGCSSLISLDLSNFNTFSVTDMNYYEMMFYYCISLISLYIDQFNVTNVNNFNYMFYYCISLVSLNLTNFNSNSNYIYLMFGNCNPNLEYCIDDNKTYEFIALLNGYKKDCSDICIKYNLKKYIIEENLCVDYCPNEYIYEYNNICYKEEPIVPIPDHSEKKNNLGIIIGIIAGVVGLIIAVIIIIICIKKYNENNKIIIYFNENNN